MVFQVITMISQVVVRVLLWYSTYLLVCCYVVAMVCKVIAMVLLCSSYAVPSVCQGVARWLL